MPQRLLDETPLERERHPRRVVQREGDEGDLVRAGLGVRQARCAERCGRGGEDGEEVVRV